jgi:hypothetical protein
MFVVEALPFLRVTKRPLFYLVTVITFNCCCVTLVVLMWVVLLQQMMRHELAASSWMVK